MKIAVLMGGKSSERDVSLNTGKAVVDSLLKSNMDVIACPFDKSINEVLSELEKADIVFNALHGGEGENGVIQGLLQSLGIKFTGSDNKGSAISMDKHLSKLIFSHNSILTPLWLHLDFRNKTGVDLSEKKFSYPVVVKPNADGSTMGVTIVETAGNLENAIRYAGEFGTEVIIEEYIPGREITVAVVDNEAYPIVEILPHHELYDYACKYTEGMSNYQCPADLPDNLTNDIQSAAIRATQLLNNRHYSRADFRLNPENKYYCLEINTLPGMTSTSLVPKAAFAAGISFDELILKIIELADG